MLEQLEHQLGAHADQVLHFVDEQMAESLDLLARFIVGLQELRCRRECDRRTS